MKHISLFSGIGGFDLASEWAGWTNVASCEINPFGRRHLAYYWPHAYHHDDIKTLTGETVEYEAQKRYGHDWRADGVVLSGGFPCQPYSLAGKRLGKEDERHLWPEMLRVIREIQPTWIVGENVLGLVNWSDGLVFDEVQTDLEAAGYEVQAYVLPACAADAPHRRDRVWIVAHYKGPGIQPGINGREKCIIKNGATVRYMSDANGEGRPTTNSHGERLQQKRSDRKLGRNRFSEPDTQNNGADWHNFPTQPPVCSRDDGFSAGLDGITFPKWRNESIKAAGNAIVPQIAYRIFDTINQFHNKTK
jgi:DNA (cytosine-5)-methyltransferase 1